MAKQRNREIFVYADWIGLGGPRLIGRLKAEPIRGKEIFSFSYEKDWLQNSPSLQLDPDLGLFDGPQYSKEDKPNFGLFLDSSPDRWGRLLMERRETLQARAEERKPVKLLETDYLLGVYDKHRMGALRFKTDPNGPWLHADQAQAAPPFTNLRSLEQASLDLERTDAPEQQQYSEWLNLLMAPGSSLGGARPKASVIDPQGQLWMAKFPSRLDERDMGGWEAVLQQMARQAGLDVADGMARRFTQERHSFLTRRFDRQGADRIHFASAMTLLGLTDGAQSSAEGHTSYLDIAEFIMRQGARPNHDLEELWRRIVFNICVSNSDDHLRNHGFLLTDKGWILSPAYDINPIPRSTGLHLNISESDNALDLGLAREVAEQFRVNDAKADTIIERVTEAVSHWPVLAQRLGIPRAEIVQMEGVFITK